MVDRQYDRITDNYEPIGLNNPVLISDLVRANKVFLLRKNIEKNAEYIKNTKVDIDMAEKVNETLIRELSHLLL